MELKLLNDEGVQAATLQASDALFGRAYNEALVHQVVVAYMANARSGNRAQKGRSEVAKSTRKPWRQKGTGRARAGMASSPLWRGGGRTFPNSPEENFSQKVNRKMYRGAMRSILSELVRSGRLRVVESLAVEEIKTKALERRLKDMGFDDVLIVDEPASENLLLSARNLHWVAVIDSAQVNPVSLLAFAQVLVTEAALMKLEERLQ